MPLVTTRLGGTADEPFCLEVDSVLAVTPASALFWHILRLPGAKAIAKKSWAMTDDFEGYFLYKNRLFLMQTPFVNVWVSLLGQPADEGLFREIETHVQGYSPFNLLLAPLAIARFFFLPFNPSRRVFERYYPQALDPNDR